MLGLVEVRGVFNDSSPERMGVESREVGLWVFLLQIRFHFEDTGIKACDVFGYRQ